MLNYEEIEEAATKEVNRLKNEAVSSRLSTLGDHDYIVGTIDGIQLLLKRIADIKREKEKHEFDLEDEDGEFGTKARKNVRGRFS